MSFSFLCLFLLVESLALVLVCLLAVIVFLPLTVWLFLGCLESFVIVLHLFLRFLSASGHFVQFCDSDIRTKKNGNKSKRSVQKLKETQNKILWNNWRCYKGKRNARQQSWELQRRSGIYFWTHITYELVHNLSSCGAGGGKCLRSDVSRVWNYRFNYMVWTESGLDTTVITLILLLQPQSI